jgi:hypothetical protein
MILLQRNLQAGIDGLFRDFGSRVHQIFFNDIFFQGGSGDAVGDIFFDHERSDRRSYSTTPSCIFDINSDGNFGIVFWSKCKKY